MILYEYPFNERMRAYLRLEHLCQRLQSLVSRDTALDHHFALVTLFEIMDVGARADLKSDVLRDLEKQKQALNAYRGNPAVTESVLDTILGQLDRSFSVLNSLPGKIGQILTENDWLMSIRSRVGIPGGTCEFDLPAYFSWQHLDPPTRRKDLERWCSCLNPLAESIQILLRLLRESGTPQKVLANEGLFQQNLPQGRTFQLLRLSIDPALDLIPEISGNRLLIAIRLMRKDSADHLQLAAVQADFELTLCS